MNYDELMRYRNPAQISEGGPESPPMSQVAQIPGLGVVTFMPDGRVVLQDPSSPSGETWLTRGPSGEIKQEQQAKNNDSALAGLLPVAAVAFGGPALGGAFGGLGGGLSGDMAATLAAEDATMGLGASAMGGQSLADAATAFAGGGSGGLLGSTLADQYAATQAAQDFTMGQGAAASGGQSLVDAATAYAPSAGLSAAQLATKLASGATNTGSAATSLSSILKNGGSVDDWLKVVGAAAPGLIGAYASGKQTDAIRSLADSQKAQFDEFKGFGAPYRTRLADLYADPNSFLTSDTVQKPVQQGSDIMARSLSMGGNPIGSGNALQQLQSYSADQLFSRLGQEKDRLAGFGGLSAYNSAAAGSPQASTTLNLAGINSGANTWNALGSSANNIFNPPQTLAEQLAALKRAGAY